MVTGLIHALAEAAIAVLGAAAAIHVYWALGGRRGAAAAVPEIPGEGGGAVRPAFRPGRPGTLLVATALLIAADLLAVRAGILESALPAWLPRLACAVMALVFAARAVGEFRYLGFTKRVRGTRFAKLDTLFYSPLCLLLAVAAGANAL